VIASKIVHYSNIMESDNASVGFATNHMY